MPDIRHMEPGPALDSLVAERVFGWKWFARSSEWLRCCWLSEVTPYSTDIAAAMRVLEEFDARGRPIRLSNKSANDYYWCYIGEGVAQGSTWAEAICKAALLAVEAAEAAKEGEA